MWEAVGQEGFISLVFSYRVLYAHLEATRKKLGIFEESPFVQNVKPNKWILILQMTVC